MATSISKEDTGTSKHTGMKEEGNKEGKETGK